MGCRKKSGGAKWKRGGEIREMDEAGRRGRILWHRREAGQRCNRSGCMKKKNRGQRGRSAVMVRKVIDDSKSEKGRGRHKGEEMNRGTADGFK